MTPRKRKNHYLLPPKPTDEEYKILMYCMNRIYEMFPDPIDKFIIAFVFEIGYTQSMAADCLDLSDYTVSKRVSAIKNKLSKGYNRDTSNQQEIYG